MNIKPPSEHDEQKNLFKRYRLMLGRFPELILAYACPNGGQRNKIVATRLKAEGVKPGVPDIHIPIARGEYSGLWIELKRLKGSSFQENQKFWLNELNKYGAFAVMCKGAEEALKITEMYLNEENGLESYRKTYDVDRSKLDAQYR